MKTLINALLMLVFFLLGLRMSGVVSKFAPFLVGSNQSSEVVIPNANENNENMPHEGQDAANIDQHNQVAPESTDPALATNAQPPVAQDQSAQQAPVPAPVPGQAPEAQNAAPQAAMAQPASAVQAQAAQAPAATATQKVETVAAPAVSAPSSATAPVKAEVKKAVSTKSSSKKK